MMEKKGSRLLGCLGSEEATLDTLNIRRPDDHFAEEVPRSMSSPYEVPTQAQSTFGNVSGAESGIVGRLYADRHIDHWTA